MSTTSSEGPLAEAYWAGAAEGRLVLQKCSNCGKVRHYPRILCDACYSFAVEPVESSGRGTVLTWTVTHHVFDQNFGSDVPYTLVTVDMEEGVRVLGRLEEGEVPSTGLPVRISFRPNALGTPIPVFVPDRGPDA